MSIVTRLVLLGTTVGALLIGAWGLRLVADEEAQLRDAERERMSLVGRAVAVATGNALRDRQLGDVVETVIGLSVVDPDLDVLIFGAHGSLVARTEGDRAPDDTTLSLVQQALDERRVAVRWFPQDEPLVLLLAEPLRADDGSLLGAVVVRSPLTDMRRHLAETRRSIVITVLVFVTAAGLTLWLTARATIGTPLRALLAAIRSLQDDRLDVRLTVRRRDELGELAVAWNQMADALGEARERLAAEQEKRRVQAVALARADKLATVGQLSAAIAHEVASPLQAVLGHAEQILEHPGEPERVRRHGDVVLRHTRRVIDVLRRMLDFVRRPVGQGEAYAVRPVVDDVLELARVEARRRGVDVVVEDQGVPPLVGEATELQQVVLNLVQNAVAASEAGQAVRVRLRTERGAVAPGAPEEDLLVLEVEDEGQGLPAGDPEHLFDPFVSYRAEGGTGLGLAVVRGLVQARRGAVGAVRLDRGTRFRVLLPVLAVAEARKVG